MSCLCFTRRVCGRVCVVCLQVQFSSPHIFCDIAVESVSNTQNGEPVKYGMKSGLSTASYQVV